MAMTYDDLRASRVCAFYKDLRTCWDGMRLVLVVPNMHLTWFYRKRARGDTAQDLSYPRAQARIVHPPGGRYVPFSVASPRSNQHDPVATPRGRRARPLDGGAGTCVFRPESV